MRIMLTDNNIAGTSLIGCWVALCRNWCRDSRSTDFDWTFRVLPPVNLTKLQMRLLNKLVQNIQCKCIKNIKAFGDCGWVHGCVMEVNMRDSYVYHLAFVT